MKSSQLETNASSLAKTMRYKDQSRTINESKKSRTILDVTLGKC